MANRYSKTGFTAREVKQLKSARQTIVNILVNRSDKNDDPKALDKLLRAFDLITDAIQISDEHKKR